MSDDSKRGVIRFTGEVDVPKADGTPNIREYSYEYPYTVTPDGEITVHDTPMGPLRARSVTALQRKALASGSTAEIIR